MTSTTQETPQQRFDRLYVTSSELCRDLGVTRPAILQARRRGLLPEPIAVNPQATASSAGLYIWERAIVQPYVDAWRLILTTRRNHTASIAAA